MQMEHTELIIKYLLGFIVTLIYRGYDYKYYKTYHIYIYIYIVLPYNLRKNMNDDYDHVFKLLLIGDAGVGKSSILLRYTDNTFDEHLQSTIGVDFKVKIANKDGKKIKLTIWDTAGQERFRTLTSAYYRGAQGIILTYDVTRRETFEALNVWLQEVDVYSPGGGANVVKLLVGNKIDKKPRAVSRREGESWARAKGMLFLESSAKTKVGIDEVFNEMLNKIFEICLVHLK